MVLNCSHEYNPGTTRCLAPGARVNSTVTGSVERTETHESSAALLPGRADQLQALAYNTA
jgi:hypothetical protein